MINKNKPLVSVITSCYNGEKFIHRFLDSVLNQTYKNIEFIFINDGSFDKTEEIVFSYQEKFKLKNINFKYIFQENKGQAVALNKGLKIFNGDYITWPDSDDILDVNYIIEAVDFLEKNKDHGMVLCKLKILNDKNLKQIGVLKRKHNSSYIFDDLVLERNIHFGGYVIRSSAFLEVKPERNIFENRGGQNYQMLLPVAFKYKCGYINKCLYSYVIRQDSHSHQAKDLDSKLERCDEHKEILINVIDGIKTMNQADKNLYFALIEKKYARKKLRIAFQFRNIKIFLKNYDILKKSSWITMQDYLLYLIIKNKIIYYLAYSFYKTIMAPIKIVKRYF